MRIFQMGGVVGAVALLLSAGTAFAEDRPTTVVQSVRAEVTKAVNTVNAAAKNAAEVRMKNASTTAASIKQTVEERLKAARAETTQRLETAREEVQTRVKAEREKATERVMEIADKAKQQVAQKLAAQFDNLNKTWTDHFAEVLDRSGVILEKIQSRADSAAASGKDVTAVTAAIQAATTTLATAKDAVAAQAAKAYTLDTSTVATTAATTTPSGQAELLQTLRTAFQTLHATLFKDLFALRDGPMKDARTALENALRALGQIPGVDEEAAAATSTAGQNQ